MARLRDTSLFGDANLVSYYELDNGALTTDSKGSNTLTNNNSVGTDTSTQKYGSGAADFGNTNTNKTLSRTDGLGVDLSGDAAISGWVNMNTILMSGVNTWTLIHWRSTTGTARTVQVNYQMINGTTFQWYIEDGSSRTATQTLVAGTWYHFVAQFSSGNIQLYVDNVKVIDAARGSSSGGNTVTMAADASTSQVASLKLDDLAFFSRALTASEVNIIYNGEPTGGFIYQSV